MKRSRREVHQQRKSGVRLLHIIGVVVIAILGIVMAIIVGKAISGSAGFIAGILITGILAWAVGKLVGKYLL